MPEDYRRRVRILWGVILCTLIYGGLLLWLGSFTGNPFLDGVIGVVLGLYVCSHPAANAVDLLFFQRDSLRQLASGWSGLGWLALNLLALVLGWLMIASGATRLAARSV